MSDNKKTSSLIVKNYPYDKTVTNYFKCGIITSADRQENKKSIKI